MSQLLINIAISFSSYLLLGISFSLIYRTVRFFHLTHGAIIAMGAYATYHLHKILIFPLWVSAILGISLSGILGVCCELTIYRAMRKRGSPPLSYLIVSLGLYIILQNILSLSYGDDPRYLYLGNAVVGHSIGQGHISTVQAWSLIFAVLSCGTITLWLRYARQGRYLRAVAANPLLCTIYGLNTDRIIELAFCLGSVLGAIAAVLSSLDTGMSPGFGFNLSLYGIVVMIIAGVDGDKGFAPAALLMATVHHLAAYYLDSRWMDAATYLGLIIFLICRPMGFDGARLKKTEV